MKLVSIDIETTGLDPRKHQILEFAAVVFDPQPKLFDDDGKPVERERWKMFEGLIRHDEIVGQPYALQLNNEILQELAGVKKTHRTIYRNTNALIAAFDEWTREVGARDEKDKIWIVGKNFAAFDDRFLCEHDAWNQVRRYHRILDVGSLLFRPADNKIRDLKECLAILGIDKEIEHRAIDDALDVATIVSRFFA